MNDFLDAARRVCDGGSALNPEVVATLLSPQGRDDPLGELTPREREVLARWPRDARTRRSRSGSG